MLRIDQGLKRSLTDIGLIEPDNTAFYQSHIPRLLVRCDLRSVTRLEISVAHDHISMAAMREWSRFLLSAKSLEFLCFDGNWGPKPTWGMRDDHEHLDLRLDEWFDWLLRRRSWPRLHTFKLTLYRVTVKTLHDMLRKHRGTLRKLIYRPADVTQPDNILDILKTWRKELELDEAFIMLDHEVMASFASIKDIDEDAARLVATAKSLDPIDHCLFDFGKYLSKAPDQNHECM